MIRSGQVAAVLCAVIAVVQLVDELSSAEADRIVFDAHVVTARPERLEHSRIETALESDGPAAVDPPARRIAGSLGILTVIENSRHHLHMPLRLHVSAHQSET